MLIKEFADLKRAEIWDLSETNDIIITKEDSDDQRVLINYKTYQKPKEMLFKLQQQNSDTMLADQFDFNPFVQDFTDIFHKDKSEDITDKDNYFQNFSRSIKSGE